MTGKQNSHDIIRRLQGIISENLSPYVDERPFALLDFPDHSNVGDSAIYLGELAFFESMRRTPSYICVYAGVDWDRLAASVPDGPLFIHGGGNFGDLWPAHQNFRQEVLRRFPSRLVIQLPQSIHFQHESNIAETRKVISNHKNFILMVRDCASQEFANSEFDCKVILCPDMAFCLGQQARRAKSIYDEVYILRTDLEKVNDDRLNPESNSFVTDWLEEPKQLRHKMRAQTLLSSLSGGYFCDRSKFEHAYFRGLARHRVERGYKLLSSGAHVTSDRLHVHILSTLLDIPHTVLDNNYGKISRFMNTWVTGWDGVSQFGQ